MFRTETLRTDLAYAASQGQSGGVASSGEFPGIQSGARVNLGQVVESQESLGSVIVYQPVRKNLGRIEPALIPFGGLIESPSAKTYGLFMPTTAYLLRSLRIKTVSGTCTVAIQIDGVNVTGLSAVAVTSSNQLVLATGANLIGAGQRLSIAVSSISTPVDLEFTLMLEML